MTSSPKHTLWQVSGLSAPANHCRPSEIFLLPCMSSDLYIKCLFIPPWWVSGHCFPRFLSSPAPKAVLYHSPLAALQMRFCGILAVEAVGFSRALPGRSLCKEDLLIYGKRGNTWIPRERNLKKIEAGWCFLFPFLSDSFWYTQFYGNFLLLSLLVDMEAPVCFSFKY